jgi:hypothetical protein
MSECSDSTAIWRFPARNIWLLSVLRKILNELLGAAAIRFVGLFSLYCHAREG